MTDKAGGAARAGYGRYAWRSDGADGKVTHLRITIEAMNLLPAQCNASILAWVGALPYPWCPAARLAEGAPGLPAVHDVVAQLQL